ncbi:hypothetical protein L7F22_066401, partial [Adiantum nelumboides]|nr:hypothetical protein [Adiantum nelumboides]
FFVPSLALVCRSDLKATPCFGATGCGFLFGITEVQMTTNSSSVACVY